LMRVCFLSERIKKPKKGGTMLVRIVMGMLVIGLLSTPAFAAEAIKIGSMNALSGPFGVLGVDQSKATKLAVDHINKDGGILGRKVEILIRDDETSPATAARVGRKLILEDKVNFIVGVNGSLSLTDRVYIVGKGRIQYEGAREQLLADRDVQQRLLGI